MPGKHTHVYTRILKLYIIIMYFIFFVKFAGVATISLFSDTIVREGNTATITCEALGYPPPTIVWSRSNGTLSDRVSTSDSVSVPTGYGNVTRVSANLIITNTSREDTGVYMCSANNSIGSDDSNISFTVQCKLDKTDIVVMFCQDGN